MSNISFVGLGNMGRPMALNLVKAGHRVTGFDLSADARDRFVAAGGRVAATLAEALADVDFVISIVNTGSHARAVYEGDGGVLALAPTSAILIDSSTIDVATARALGTAAQAAGFAMVDAPVSGGTMGAAAGTLTFMVGGAASTFEKVKPLLEAMGRTIVHAGPSGNGQAAKICNNMIAGVTAVAVSEAFVLGQKLGLDHQTLFDIASRSSGQCWAMTTYCPVPGPVPTSPANHDYEPGFAVAMMLKDLRLSQAAAEAAGASTPMGAAAAALYQIVANAGFGQKDFSIVARLGAGELGKAE